MAGPWTGTGYGRGLWAGFPSAQQRTWPDGQLSSRSSSDRAKADTSRQSARSSHRQLGTCGGPVNRTDPLHRDKTNSHAYILLLIENRICRTENIYRNKALTNLHRPCIINTVMQPCQSYTFRLQSTNIRFNKSELFSDDAYKTDKTDRINCLSRFMWISTAELEHKNDISAVWGLDLSVDLFDGCMVFTTMYGCPKFPFWSWLETCSISENQSQKCSNRPESNSSFTTSPESLIWAVRHYNKSSVSSKVSSIRARQRSTPSTQIGKILFVCLLPIHVTRLFLTPCTGLAFL